MLEGLVQNDHALTAGMIPRRMGTVTADAQAATLRAPGEIDRATYREVAARPDLLADTLATIPTTSASTFDEKVLRARLDDGELAERRMLGEITATTGR